MNEILKERFFKLEQDLELADAEIAKVTALQNELHEAKADNARLAAACREIMEAGKGHTFTGKTAIAAALGKSTAIHDLLAPTLSCLKTIAQSKSGINAGLAHVELQRLRALCGEGKQVDK